MPSTALLLVIVPIIAFVTVALVAYAFAAPNRSTLQDRLRAYGYDVKSLGAADLSEPFWKRVIAPVGGTLVTIARSLTPKGMKDYARSRVEAAGNPVGVGTFLALRVLAMLGLPALIVIPRLIARDLSTLHLIVAILMVYIGSRLPDIWLSFRIDARRDKIRKALPDALDLIVVCVEAGYGLEAAITKVTERTSGPLSQEFKRTLAEIRMGKFRRDALRDMSTRLGVPDVQSFIASVIQADQMGVSIAQALRVQADAVRVRRRQRAEELMRKAPIKMLFPLFLFIFPVLMMVILAPAAFRLSGFFSQMAH